ncbi:MAG: EutN/CcmL family microcompartment protein, partial [bacterium]
MKPGKVIGRVVATQKYHEFEGERFLVVQPTDWDQNPVGDAIIATDTVSAGAGEMVFYVESR